MKLNAPTKNVFFISVVLAALALLPMIGIAIPLTAGYTTWVALAAYAVLAAGNLIKGL